MSFISGKKKKAFFGYLAAAGGVLLFGAVYEAFSFGVWSPFMGLAFLVPLAGSLGPAFARFLPESGAGEGLYRSGIACMTAGSLVRGVLEIYGTTNSLWFFYPVSSVLLFLGCAAAYAVAAHRP